MKKTQSVMEYALLIAVVAAAFTAMHVYMRRSVNAQFKVIEETINRN